MLIYWSDRNNAPAPSAAFHLHPFSPAPPISLVPITSLPPPTSAKILRKTFSPTYPVWKQNVARALSLIQKNRLQKVVLARSCTLDLTSAPDPFAITAALKPKALGAFVYCVKTPTFAFLGASPELLFSRTQRSIQTEAIAGTRKRGSSPAEDIRLQHNLLTSEKDLREFSHIPAYLQAALTPLCTSPLAFTPLSIHQTHTVQHLYQQGTATLLPAITDAQIISAIHPTPALCGYPKPQALSLIHELEPFSRGFYGGVLGWSTPEASQYIVSIRSCLLIGNQATLYSGTGIVEGSNPEEEWEELNEKLRLYESILDH